LRRKLSGAQGGIPRALGAVQISRERATRYRPELEGDLTAGPLLFPGNPGTFEASCG